MKLELRNIWKSFGEKEVLKGISFTAESGKAFGLLGRNGAGKPTTIRILMDVFGANEGGVFLDGKPIDYKAVRLGYLPEERGLYPKKKIIDQLLYFALLHGMKRSEAVKSIDGWLDRLGMSEHRNKRLDTLSKGNQQKIQLVTALAHNYVRDKLIVRSPQAEEIRKDLGSCCTAREGRELLIKLGSVEEKQGMMRSLTEKYDLDEVRVFEPSLNDIFVEYAKEQN